MITPTTKMFQWGGHETFYDKNHPYKSYYIVGIECVLYCILPTLDFFSFRFLQELNHLLSHKYVAIILDILVCGINFYRDYVCMVGNYTPSCSAWF